MDYKMAPTRTRTTWLLWTMDYFPSIHWLVDRLTIHPAHLLAYLALLNSREFERSFAKFWTIDILGKSQQQQNRLLNRSANSTFFLSIISIQRLSFNLERHSTIFKLSFTCKMWLTLIVQLVNIFSYFWDIGVDILVGKEQIGKTFPDDEDFFKGKFDFQWRKNTVVKISILFCIT